MDVADQGTGEQAAGTASEDSGGGAAAAIAGQGQSASASGTGGSKAELDKLRRDNEQLRKDLDKATHKHGSVKGDLEGRVAALEGELAIERSRAQQADRKLKSATVIDTIAAELPIENRELAKHVLRSYSLDGLDFAAEDPSPAKKSALERLKKEFEHLTVSQPKDKGRQPVIPGVQNGAKPGQAGTFNAAGERIL